MRIEFEVGEKEYGKIYHIMCLNQRKKYGAVNFRKLWFTLSNLIAGRKASNHMKIN